MPQPIFTNVAVAFQANTNTLWVVRDTARDLHLPMMAGTSPSIIPLSGGWVAAYQSDMGYLSVGQDIANNPPEPNLPQLGMMAGTSPSATPVGPGHGWLAAFQANSNDLWVVGEVGGNFVTRDVGGNLTNNLVLAQFGMMAGTSPSITTTATGWVAAFQANTGYLHVVGENLSPAGEVSGLYHQDPGARMMAGTSPSITTVQSNTGGDLWVAAYQSDTGYLSVVRQENLSPQNLGFQMLAGTSPTIATVGGYWMAAFQANSSYVWVVGGTVAGPRDLAFGMMAGTSPSITGGWAVAFQANTSYLWVVGETLPAQDLQLGMRAGTSPSITWV
jgi:hypothetical protein